MRKSAEGVMSHSRPPGHRLAASDRVRIGKFSSIWNSAGSGFVFRSRLNRVTTVWKPCASITVHCLSAKLAGSNLELEVGRAAKRGLVLDLDRDRTLVLGDAHDPGVAHKVDVIGEQEFQRRLTREYSSCVLSLWSITATLRPSATISKRAGAAYLKQHAAGAGDSELVLRSVFHSARSEQSRRSRRGLRRASRWRAGLPQRR